MTSFEDSRGLDANEGVCNGKVMGRVLFSCCSRRSRPSMWPFLQALAHSYLETGQLLAYKRWLLIIESLWHMKSMNMCHYAKFRRFKCTSMMKTVRPSQHYTNHSPTSCSLRAHTQPLIAVSRKSLPSFCHSLVSRSKFLLPKNFTLFIIWLRFCLSHTVAWSKPPAWVGGVQSRKSWAWWRLSKAGEIWTCDIVISCLAFCSATILTR